MKRVASVAFAALLVVVFVPADSEQLWNQADIGGPTRSGSATFHSPDRAVITASGSGISGTSGGTSDQFHFVFQEVSGALLIQARLDSLPSEPSTAAKAGIMFRTSLADNTSFAYTMIQAATAIEVPGAGVHWRSGEAVDASGTWPFPIRPSGLPVWVRSVLQDGVVTGFASADPENTGWVALDSVRVPANEAGSLFAGIAVTSGDERRPVTAIFSEITVRQLPECMANLAARRSDDSVELNWMNVGEYDGFRILRTSLMEGTTILATIGGNAESYVDGKPPEDFKVTYEAVPFVSDHDLCVVSVQIDGPVATGPRISTSRGSVISPRPFPADLPVDPEGETDTEPWAEVLPTTLVANRQVNPGEDIVFDLELESPSYVAVSAEFSGAETSQVSVGFLGGDNLITQIEALELTGSRLLFKDLLEITPQMLTAEPNWAIRLSNNGDRAVSVFAFAGIRPLTE